MISVDYEQTKAGIKSCFKAGLVPMLTGSPGLGKSDIIRQIAKEYQLKVIDIRLSQYDPTDIAGLPAINKNGTFSHLPLDTFPIESTPIPNNYKGWILFFDEFNSASNMVQAAAYRIVLDREIGQHKLHKNCVVACAGNLMTDSAIVNRQSTAMQSRLVHLKLEVQIEQWINWANKNNIDYRITSYIGHRPDNLMNFDPNHNDCTFACPRTWMFTSKLIKEIGKLDDMLPLLAGTISEGIAREFIIYSNQITNIPTIKEIRLSPSVVAIPEEPGNLYAVANMIGAYADEKYIEKYLTYIDRLPIEFSIITVRAIKNRNPRLMNCEAMSKWFIDKGNQIF